MLEKRKKARVRDCCLPTTVAQHYNMHVGLSKRPEGRMELEAMCLSLVVEQGNCFPSIAKRKVEASVDVQCFNFENVPNPGHFNIELGALTDKFRSRAVLPKEKGIGEEKNEF
ncbi:hypothetical protein NC653_007536 [Populus alba x Populus x berolinensis]|uniref:Uncharacterized protein n=1 Tax=Populus alba x Populus x berolinensis TaxID=444605 RepID=A0AAD6WFU6_9ROSI|nr:hypothetical protein NC653_007536 [Populus alba x Populus x berolinensis]